MFDQVMLYVLRLMWYFDRNILVLYTCLMFYLFRA